MSKKMIMPGETIGIIGGGQLGRMMALAAKEAGFKIAVLDPAENSPCGQVADIEITASFDDRDALLHLAEVSDVVTFEFENIDYDALKWLCEKTYIPQGAEIIKITQDRILEKEALTKADVDVAPYAVIKEKQEIYDHIQALGYPSVLKTSRGGYDGKGQFVIKSEEDIEEASQLLKHSACVLEKWIAFEKEISVIVSRNPNKEINIFPVGENIHVDNILHETIVPARISESTREKAIELASKIADAVDLVGTLAVEMFVGADGEIYINELAPRPHNSGHYSIEACETSQFAQHIRAVCNWPLKSTNLLKPVIMVNILGEHVENVISQIEDRPNWSVHLYGKSEAKVKRKMGHITILTNNINETLYEVDNSGIWNK
ncbi:5-(carboxyamino)imidazole ribonucleotide synthase [Oikeobacillus pervagus]|uniref:N5-carboxyaminoimidazole ribonucleotide synthase n=1 Tax=Oikeobacillus pervagus TaxID=1325931 RepID=A0AAJ1T6M2_9BACI|nr:5-(carboxyamino)imidazole ribonucleotide synthase [Oikeobacillus pervagus]MDQ0215585.1 5-(carboxyamino)imidazole ribonucleotide synthase [Oikeobacillus pervagus]